MLIKFDSRYNGQIASIDLWIDDRHIVFVYTTMNRTTNKVDLNVLTSNGTTHTLIDSKENRKLLGIMGS